MANWRGINCQKVLQSVFVLWFTLSSFAFSVQPRVMPKSWYAATSQAVGNLFNAFSGSATEAEEVSEEKNWQDDIKSAFVSTKQSLDDFLSDMTEGENVITSSFEAGKAKLEELRNNLPEIPSLGIDTEYIKNHISEFDWNSFSAQLMPSSLTSETNSKEEIDSMAEIPPECSMTAPEIIRYSGYPVEVHTATTEDGYILQMHRIPYPPSQLANNRARRGRPVVFLQHGILADSVCWIANGPDRSLPFLLSDAGYDVWLGNVRGSTYSRKHVTMDANSDERFWRFSWQDMSEYDLPAMINKALEVSQRPRLYYIGHSQGSLIAFARLSEDPEMNKKIELMFGLGPVSTLAHITSPVKSLTFLGKIAQFGLSLFGGAEILPHSQMSRFISAKLHKVYNSETSNHSIGESMAYHGNNLMMFLCGVHPEHYYHDRMPVYFSHTPAGTSLHNLLHMSQLVESGRMRKWDYMSESENKKAYNGEIEPPEYNVANIKTPIILFVGSDDQLADPTDGKKLADKLKSLVHYQLLDGWDHLDFLWGKLARQSVYKDIIDFIQKSEEDHRHHFHMKRPTDEL